MKFSTQHFVLASVISLSFACAPPNNTTTSDDDLELTPEEIVTQDLIRTMPLPGLTSSFYSSGAQCDEFIHPNGSFGYYGGIVRDTIYYILNKYPDRKVSLLVDPHLPSRVDGLDNLCPNFHLFSEDERIHFWVWVFASIAWHESKCGTGANMVGAVNPNGLSVGLLHMPHDLKYRFDYSNQSLGTGSCREHHPTPGINVEGFTIRDRAMLDPRLNIKCGMDALLTALRGFHTAECYNGWDHRQASSPSDCRPNLFENYWREFKGESRGVSQMIKEHPLCTI